MIRILGAIVASLVAFIGAGFPAAGAATVPCWPSIVYVYDAPAFDQPTTHIASERGPPGHAHIATTYTAFDHGSHGALARPTVVTEASGYTYNDHVQLVQVAVVVSSLGGRSARAWALPLRGGRVHVAANAADDVARLTASQQRSLQSLQSQVETHHTKLDAYRANPDAYDNLGILERAPTPEIRQRIIDGRIRHLETEIRTFQDQIDKLLGGGS